jgi:hypothetical protein
MQAVAPNGNGHAAEPVPYHHPLAAPPVMNAAQFRELSELVTNVVVTSRLEWQRLLFDRRRNYENECGHPPLNQPVDPWKYKEIYDRDGLAQRVVHLLPDECFQVPFEVYEDEDPNTKTRFELAFKELCTGLNGEHNWFKDQQGSLFHQAVQEADRKAGIGRYGVLLLGFDDVKAGGVDALARPVEGLTETGSAPGAYGTMNYVANYALTSNAVTEPAAPPPTPDAEGVAEPEGARADEEEKSGWTPKVRLLFMQPFFEGQAVITKFETNPSSPRYGLPAEYNVTFNDPKDVMGSGGATVPMNTVRVHWSRVIHFCEEKVYHTPRLHPVIDRVLDARKVLDTDAEGFYRSGVPLWAFVTDPALGGDVRIGNDDRNRMRQQMEQMVNGFQRYGLFNGVTPQALSPVIADPTAHWEKQVEAVALGMAVPKRKLMGSERGELASSDDESDWCKKLRRRQDQTVTPKYLAPLLNRLILVGCLPEPEGGEFHVDWPDIETQSEAEKAQAGLVRVQELAAWVQGGQEQLAPEDFWTQYMDKTAEEAAQIVENAKDHAAEQAQSELDDRMAAGLQGQDLKQQAIDRGIEPPPPQGDWTATANEWEQAVNEDLSGVFDLAAGPPAPEVLDGILAANAFCPTGEGGGQDNSCAAHGGAHVTETLRLHEAAARGHRGVAEGGPGEAMKKLSEHEAHLRSLKPAQVMEAYLALGFRVKPKNKDEAVKIIMQRISGRMGSYDRADA